jgi:tetratricopeptide (TPR) repeat protein
MFFGWSDTPERQTAVAFENARRATELDPREPIAYTALASAYSLKGEVQNALDAAKRAVELNPSMPEVYLMLSWVQLLNGDLKTCVASDERTRQLDPHGPWATMADDNIAGAYWEMGRYQESLEAARRLVSARPTYYWGYVYIALGAVAPGDLATARAAIVDARRANPDLSIESLQRAYGVVRPEVDARRNAALRQPGLE